MVLTVEVRVFWVVVRESRGSYSSSSSPRCESSFCAWPAVLVRLRVFHVVDVSWILELWSPSHFPVALSRFISFGHSFAMIIIRQNVFFKFVKEFFDCLGFLSREMRSCWPWGQTFDQRLDRCLVIGFWDLRSLLHEPSHEVSQWFSVFLFAVVQV
jgi:hypothetical protein